jgi:hypothetical protein
MGMLWKNYPNLRSAESRKKRLEEIRGKQEVYKFIDSASTDKIERPREEIKHLKETEEE